MIRSARERTLRHRILPYGLALLLILAVYILLNTKYRIYYMDDAWCLSYVYNHAFHGVDLDTLVRPPGHPRSILYFGKLHALFATQVLDSFGWTKGTAHALSSVYIFLAASVWFAILRSLRFSFEVAASMALGTLIFPAFFSAANLTRPDALAFLCASFAFLLFLREHYLLAGFFCVVATEVHIMGCSAGFYLLAHVIVRRAEFFQQRARLVKQLAFFGAGVVLGCFTYYLLHYRYFEPVAAFRSITQHTAMRFPVKNLMVAYFFGMDWLQKLPELLFTVIMLVIFFWRLRTKADSFVRTFLIVMLVSTLFLHRPNGNYMLFIQPALVLTFIHSFELWGRLGRCSAVVLGYFLSYYGVIWAIHRDFDHQRLTERIRSGLVRPDLPVVGILEDWFAVMDRTFYPIYPSAPSIASRNLSEAYLIRNDYLRSQVGNYDSTMRYMAANFELTKLYSVPAYAGQVAEVFLARRKWFRAGDSIESN